MGGDTIKRRCELISPNGVKRPVLRYHGGKWLLAKWITSHFPAHRTYVEPYCGAASILMWKKRTYAECINDMDGSIVALFRVLRDPAQARELERLLRLTPFARVEFESAYLPAADPIEHARRLIVRSFMGFGSAACNPEHRTGWRGTCDRSNTTPAWDWKNYPDAIPAMTERLQGVVIESRPAVEVIRRHDKPHTLHYCDPPYPLNTRSSSARENNCYVYEMSESQHRELAETLNSVVGMVVLSGYACPLYDEDLYSGWYRVERDTHADGARDRTEVLWINKAAKSAFDQTGLFQ
jgi:DNA adenine methylase